MTVEEANAVANVATSTNTAELDQSELMAEFFASSPMNQLPRQYRFTPGAILHVEPDKQREFDTAIARIVALTVERDAARAELAALRLRMAEWDASVTWAVSPGRRVNFPK